MAHAYIIFWKMEAGETEVKGHPPSLAGLQKQTITTQQKDHLEIMVQFVTPEEKKKKGSSGAGR